MSRRVASEPASPSFNTTDWSAVLTAGKNEGPTSAAALEELCRKYWYPIYVFIRRRGANPPEAEDLTQAFFAYVLEKETLKKVDPHKGKFRTFLLTAVTNFLTNDWDKQHTVKRGGQRQIISLEDAAPEERYRQESAESLTPEKLFERRWAFTLVQEVLTRLEREYQAAGNAGLFATLESGLTGEIKSGSYADWAAALGMNEGAVRVALHRLRRRFGQLLRGEVTQIVASPAEVDDEIRHLFAAIAA
jgi:RNA polymerase sigma factor (sigma-70 family)